METQVLSTRWCSWRLFSFCFCSTATLFFHYHISWDSTLTLHSAHCAASHSGHWPCRLECHLTCLLLFQVHTSLHSAPLGFNPAKSSTSSNTSGHSAQPYLFLVRNTRPPSNVLSDQTLFQNGILLSVNLFCCSHSQMDISHLTSEHASHTSPIFSVFSVRSTLFFPFQALKSAFQQLISCAPIYTTPCFPALWQQLLGVNIHMSSTPPFQPTILCHNYMYQYLGWEITAQHSILPKRSSDSAPSSQGLESLRGCGY